MINSQTQSSFNNNSSFFEVKQTAQSFNTQLNSLGHSTTFQQKEIKKVPYKNPNIQAFGSKSDAQKQVLTQQQRENSPLKPCTHKGITRMANQQVQNQQATLVRNKNESALANSQPKLTKVPTVKQFSPFQPKHSADQIVSTQQSFKATNIQTSANNKFVQTPKTTRYEPNIITTEREPRFKRFSTKTSEEQINPEQLNSEQALPKSRQFSGNNEKKQISNSTGFNPQIRTEVEDIKTKQDRRQNSTGQQQQQQQENSRRTNSLQKMTIPTVQVVNVNFPNENFSINSRTPDHLLNSLRSQKPKNFLQRIPQL
ncbi:unnamed protein product (macronuclear) [Paramecium tetraurelia]|uniref:Uncharacterized protein n=1 Tax=Paramecium tetraurelia TaxID=5888 RepID=A0BSY9_PARTE|nr:uncharacterized protein GSPATT00031888001 [Paramecium tetraurelia]CAK61656.1 unnamed protein product [Paramecium tetraurelia]|eukprot:XP_001429054.1 hypothetical protein (macronuclear) [Paramecium tetraurelia strain d4-2]